MKEIDKYYGSLEECLIELSDFSQRDLMNIEEDIDEIIECGIQDERTISSCFDHLLDLPFSDYEENKRIYYKLLNYVHPFDRKLADDYEEIFNEIFSEED